MKEILLLSDRILQQCFTGDKIKILKCKDIRFCKKNSLFFISAIQKSFSSFSWGNQSFSINVLKEQIIKLPQNNRDIDFDFMESFIAQIERKKMNELDLYLRSSGLNDYELTLEEQQALDIFRNLEWKMFNLCSLFGPSTRGKRLKSEDRVSGNLPFVTAGESNEGISAFIGNNVEIFSENTTTIDMFGSAKYRNFKYGADDHIAVVHTENLPKLAAIFITSSIHKSSHSGKFDYSRNFYAKDADELFILLPVSNGEPDFCFMEKLISAVHKIVIKDVVLHLSKENYTFK